MQPNQRNSDTAPPSGEAEQSGTTIRTAISAEGVLEQICYECGATVASSAPACEQCGMPVVPDPLLGTTIDDRYVVLRCIGVGAMGAVYEAEHQRLRKRFALKVIRPEFGQNVAFAARFEREALSTSRLQHPNCVSVTDFGKTADGALYLVMELIVGKALSAYRRARLPLSDAFDITRQVLEGLKHAHDAGIIHRDIKPDNIILTDAGGLRVCKLIDFGIAKVSMEETQPREPLTRIGVVIGTPDYMAPEQALGGAIDHRVDLYATAVVFWEMLTGGPLFDDDTLAALINRKLSADPPRLRDVAPDYSPSLEALLVKALARNPDDRFQSADDFLATLAAVETSDETTVEDVSALVTNTQQTSLVASWRSLVRDAAARVRKLLRQDALRRNARVAWQARLSQPRTLLVVAAVALCITALAIATWPRSTPGDLLFTIPPRPAQSASEPGMPLPATRPPARTPAAHTLNLPKDLAAELEAVRGLVIANACDAAVPRARAVATKNPAVAAAHYALGASLMCGQQFDEGLEPYGRAVTLDARYRTDARLIHDVSNLLRVAKLRLAAIDFLEQKVGRPAVEILLEYTDHPVREVRQYVIAALTRLGATDRINWLASLERDLNQIQSCDERRAVVQRIAALGGADAAAVLKRARDARNSGLSKMFGDTYRHQCIRKDLQRAIEKLEGRSADAL